jgi:hypothetical protein
MLSTRQSAATLVTLMLVLASLGAAKAADRPYTEGPVEVVSSIRTEPGMFEEYMKYLAGPYKQLLDEYEKAGIIVGYSIYTATPQSPHDPDLYLVTVYRNMAALDGLNERTDAITERIAGDLTKQGEGMASRGKLRTFLGAVQMRQLILK